MKKITCLLLFTLLFITTQNLLYAQCSSTAISCGSSTSGLATNSDFDSSSYACSGNSNTYAGADQIYSFSVASGTDISVKITVMRAEFDLFLFQGGCAPSNCVGASTNSGFSTESIDISNATGGTYYIIVDGVAAGETGFFRIALDCETSGGSTFSCNSAPTLQCNSNYSLTTIGGANQLGISDYSACFSSSSSFSGNDRIFKINVPSGLDLTLTMTELSADLDMFLFEKCTGNTLINCAGRSTNNGSNNEQITVSSANASSFGVYYLVIDGYNASQQSDFLLNISCNPYCEPTVYNNCNLISYIYNGNPPFSNTYSLIVPNTVPNSGTWTATNTVNGQITTLGTGRAISTNFPYGGFYKVCYTYQDSDGCDVSCCKFIKIPVNPYNCEEIEQSYNPYTGEWTLSLNNIPNSYVIYWRNAETGERIESYTNSIVVTQPDDEECLDICVYYYNPSTDYYQVCCVSLCEDNDGCLGAPQSISCPPTDDPVCACNNIQYLNSCYARRAGAILWNSSPCPPRTPTDCEDISMNFESVLRYSFSANDGIPSGGWIATGGGYGNQVANLGSGTSVTTNFPGAGTYTVCLNYEKNGQNEQCCQKLEVLADPYECRDLRRTIDGSNTTIFIPGIAPEDVIQWRNDATGEELATDTDRITVPIPALDECGYYSVLFYDVACGCTRVCCIAICTTNEIEEQDGCGVVKNASLNCKADGSYDYNFTLDNQSGRSNLTADITILSSIGPTFDNCSNVTTITGINGEVAVSLNFQECIVPIQAGMEVAYKIVLNDAQGGWFCNLDPMAITLPSCDATPSTCNAACVGKDLVKNGNFEGGYWAFTSELDDKCACDDGTYCIATNMTGKCPDNTNMTANGKFLIVDAATNLPATIWAQDDIQVKAGNNYSFSFDLYAGNADNASPTFELWVGNTLLNGSVTGTGGEWVTVNSNWTADANATLDLSIRQSQSGGATTFAMDNIRFTECDAATGDPLQDLAWIQEYVGDANYEIKECTLNGETAYLIGDYCTSTDGTTNYYDCNGNLICSTSIAGTTCDGASSNCTTLQLCNAPNSQNTENRNARTTATTMALENYPNPFRNSTTIQFSLPAEMQASLSVFDTNGRLVYTTTANFSMGINQVELDASNGLSAGVYYYRLATANESITKSMLMMQ